MPTKKPRVLLTLDPDFHETIATLAELQGVSKSEVLREILEPSHEPLKRAVSLLQAAHEVMPALKEKYRDSAFGAEREVLGWMQSGMETMMRLQSELGRMGESWDGTNPHVVTRGSESNKCEENQGDNQKPQGGSK